MKIFKEISRIIILGFGAQTEKKVTFYILAQKAFLGLRSSRIPPPEAHEHRALKTSIYGYIWAAVASLVGRSYKNLS